MDYSQRLRRLETEKDTDLSTLRKLAQVNELEIGTAIREVHRFQNIIIKLTQEKGDLKQKKKTQFITVTSNNGTSYMNWRSCSCVNIRRMSACSKTWLNQARTAEGSREPRNSRQSSGVF